MRKILFSLALTTSVIYLNAQAKVFKEVSDAMSSQIKVIKQDNALVGYLAFTRLEKTSADSFNYRITIMDENLNDIGSVNFKEQSLSLEQISFEQDVLCLAYLKGNVIGNTYSKKEYNAVKDDSKTFVMLQFLGLDGKIIKTNTLKANIDISTSYEKSSKLTASGNLKNPLQVNNIPNKGFACFYGDESSRNLAVYDAQGQQGWQKKISQNGQFFVMRTNEKDIYLLAKHEEEKPTEGGFELLGYNVTDGSAYDRIKLQDKQGNDLKVLAFDNDPSTGKLYLSGNIINPEYSKLPYSGRQISRGPFSGIFTININGPKKSDVSQVYSYWDDGSQEGSISSRGKFSDNGAYALFSESFRDYNGNTYFAGSALIKRTKWGAISSSIVCAPLVLPSIGILALCGTTKCKITDVMLIKQTPKGIISFDNSVPADNTNYYRGMVLTSEYDHRNFYRVTNTDTRTNYLIVDDVKNILIYNVTQKKVQRTIPHKDGQIKINVYPAKEGHILVSEYNKKEKYTRFSIEAI